MENQVKEIEIFSKKVRKIILEMAYGAGAGSAHFGGALSIISPGGDGVAPGHYPK